MSDDWQGVDAWLEERLVPADPALAAALEANAAAGLPDIAVSALQGRMLHLFARMAGARRILEIGTLGGYSTIWLARALPEGGQLVTLEREAKHAAVARENIVRAGLGDRVEVRLGAALDLLPEPRRRRAVRLHLHRCRQGKQRRLPRLGAPPRAPRRHDRLRQRDPRRPHPRHRERRPRRYRHPSLLRAPRRRAPPRRHRHPDGRRQGLGRLRARDRRLSPTAAEIALAAEVTPGAG